MSSSVRFSDEAVAVLARHSWPGNVRQLENTVFRAMVLCESGRLDLQDFPQIASLVEGYEIKIPPAPQLAPKPALPQGAAAIAGGSPLPKGGPAVADGVAFGIPAALAGARQLAARAPHPPLARVAAGRQALRSGSDTRGLAHVLPAQHRNARTSGF